MNRKIVLRKWKNNFQLRGDVVILSANRRTLAFNGLIYGGACLGLKNIHLASILIVQTTVFIQTESIATLFVQFQLLTAKEIWFSVRIDPAFVVSFCM